MKNIYILITLLIISASGFSQAPEGVIYQAEARDNAGKVIANKSLEVQVNILEGAVDGNVVWEGNHQIITNEFGIFTIVIGTGTNNSGALFKDINWGENTHFLNVKVKKSHNADWIDMGTSQFLSVPYALYAKTAGTILESPELMQKSAQIGVPSQTWSLFGNSKTDPDKDKLGTTDQTDLVFVTNNLERLRITSDGQLITAPGVGLELGGNLQVHGEKVVVDKDLFVGRDVFLNVDENFNPRGKTINFGNFTVENGSPTLLTGVLNVNGDVQMGHDLSVMNDLNVGNTTFSKSLMVKDNLPNSAYLATFENTNKEEGDGIKIKLGKVKTSVIAPTIPDVLTDSQIEGVKNLLKCNVDPSVKMNLLKDITIEGIKADAEMIGGLTVGIGNLIVGFVNGQLGLPLKSPDINIIPSVTTFPGFKITMPPGIPNISIPKKSIGPYPLPRFTLFPKIPNITLSKLGINEIHIEDPDFWGIPNICLDDNGAGVLNNENEFITFTDNADNKMGSIRAVSVTDWAMDYLNPIFLFKLRGALNSAVDKKHARYHFKSEISEAIKNYASIGVEYSSGNGDYAEWLERTDPNEIISAGDIVGIKGGKITKNLAGAEQVMAVSHQPIVLGNVPSANKIQLGNNIAFMGQIPVKIMGPVASGDYIIGNSEIAGYGKAVNPKDMMVEDFKLAVGRAWEANETSGPKMVNTVVGVHNGDFINILKRYESKFQESEKRLESIESKVELINELLNRSNL